MNSARAHGRHRARQAAALLAGVGVAATGVVAGLAHASDPAAGSRMSTAAARTSSVASSPSVASGSPVQPGIAGGAPHAQSGGS